jgi:hypothetical protein
MAFYGMLIATAYVAAAPLVAPSLTVHVAAVIAASLISVLVACLYDGPLGVAIACATMTTVMHACRPGAGVTPSSPDPPEGTESAPISPDSLRDGDDDDDDEAGDERPSGDATGGSDGERSEPEACEAVVVGEPEHAGNADVALDAGEGGSAPPAHGGEANPAATQAPRDADREQKGPPGRAELEAAAHWPGPGFSRFADITLSDAERLFVSPESLRKAGSDNLVPSGSGVVIAPLGGFSAQGVSESWGVRGSEEI